MSVSPAGMEAAAPVAGELPASQTDLKVTNKRPHLDSIDALRGIACLMVLFGHCEEWFQEPSFNHWHFYSINLDPHHWFKFGHGGVDLFFVLSGFCLSYPILSRSGKNVDWKRYAVHRVRRILPAYWAALLLFSGISLLISHLHLHALSQVGMPELPPLRQYLYSVFLAQSMLNRSFWTLTIEWRWYFLFPLLILLWRRFGSAGVMVVTMAISLVYVFVFIPMHSAKLDFITSNVFAWLALFGFGIWAADLCTRRNTTKIGDFLIRNARWGILLCLLRLPLMYPSVTNALYFDSWRLAARIFTWGPLWFFVVIAAVKDAKFQQKLSWRPLVSVGLFSYSLYLTHEPLLRCVAALVMPLHWPDTWLFLFHQVLLPGLLIGFAYLFYRVAEKPFLRKPGQA